MNEIWRQIKVYAKTIAVFLVGVFGPPFVKILLGEAPFPQSKQEWINWVVAVGGSALAAALVRNKITQGQLDKDPAVQGGIVVDDPKNKDTVIPPATPNIPPAAGDWPKP